MPNLNPIIGAAAALALMTLSAQAQSLAGQKGDVRYPAQFHSSKDACSKAYAKYVGASGHSAYAQTPSGRMAHAEAFFCGTGLNAPSKKAAEERALESCKSVGKKIKAKKTGRCEIYASK